MSLPDPIRRTPNTAMAKATPNLSSDQGKDKQKLSSVTRALVTTVDTVYLGSQLYLYSVI